MGAEGARRCGSTELTIRGRAAAEGDRIQSENRQEKGGRELGRAEAEVQATGCRGCGA